MCNGGAAFVRELRGLAVDWVVFDGCPTCGGDCNWAEWRAGHPERGVCRFDMSNYILEQAFAGNEPWVSIVFSPEKLAEIERNAVSGPKIAPTVGARSKT